MLTKAPALGPVEMEQFVTYPIEAAMNGLPKLVEIRSISRYGLSAVTVVFEDGVDVYFARQLVAERLVQAREAIPDGFGNPEMGPVTTGLGDVLQFTVEGEGVSPMERRTILDWMIAPRLRAVPGVTEVNAWGGLAQAVPGRRGSREAPGATASRSSRCSRPSSAAAGTRAAATSSTTASSTSSAARASSDRSPTSRRSCSRPKAEGTPVTVGNVAQVREGAMLRIGVATADGRGETVIGLVQMLAGENALEVATRARQAVEELAAVPAQGRPDRPLLRPRRSSCAA